MNWADHHCEFDHHHGRLLNEDEVLGVIQRRLRSSGRTGTPTGDGATGDDEPAEPGEDADGDLAPRKDWQEVLYRPIVVLGAVATGVITWFAARNVDDVEAELLVAILAGLVAGLVGAATNSSRWLALVLLAEVSAVTGVGTWNAIGNEEPTVAFGLNLLEPTAQVVGAALLVIVANLLVIGGLIAIGSRAEYAVRRLIISAAIAVGWWSALNISSVDSLVDAQIQAGLEAGLYGAVAVLGASLVISLLEDLRLWLKSGSTGATVTELLNELDRIVDELTALRALDDPAAASELRLGLLEPTERAARLVERQLGRSLSRQAARQDSRRVLPYVTTRGWLRADLALRGEAIRQWRRDLVLPERNNADRLRSEVIHVMAHVQRWEWLGIPTVHGADPARHRRRRQIRVLLVSAFLFAPLVFVLVSLAMSWEVGVEQQLVPFAFPLALAGIAVASGAVSLRDLSGSVVPGSIG